MTSKCQSQIWGSNSDFLISGLHLFLTPISIMPSGYCLFYRRAWLPFHSTSVEHLFMIRIGQLPGVRRSPHSSRETSTHIDYFHTKSKTVISAVNEVQRKWYKNTEEGGCPLVVQWSRLHLPKQSLWVPSRKGGPRSHMPHGQNTETQKQYCNRFHKDLKKNTTKNPTKNRGGGKTFLPGKEKFGNGRKWGKSSPEWQ